MGDPQFQAGVGAAGAAFAAGGNGRIVLQFTAAPTISKAFSPDEILSGGTSTLTITVTHANTGPLTGASFTDTLPAGVVIASAPNASTTCGGAVTANVGSSSVALTGASLPSGSCTMTVTVTSSTLGVHTNTIPAGAITTALGTTNADPATADLEVLDPTPTLSIVKSSDMVDPATEFVAGHVVTYSFVITNTGNVDITSVSAVETAFSGTGAAPTPVCPPTAAFLAGGDQVICTATYTVTAADVIAGQIGNTAEAHGTGPGAASVVSAPSSLAIPAPVTTSLQLIKTVTPGIATADDTITYRFALTNTGNQTLSAIDVEEIAFSADGPVPVATCPPGDILPGATIDCTADYTITQTDFDLQLPITNTAHAITTDPLGNTVTSNDSSAVVNMAAAVPALSIVKSVTAGATIAAAGQVIQYQFLVTNIGNVTISGITVSETTFTGLNGPLVPDCTGFTTTLAPTSSSTCVASYTVTQADIDSGATQISNGAEASGDDPGGAPADAPESVALADLLPSTTLSIVKSATTTNIGGDSGVGDEIQWVFLVTNTGTTTLTAVDVDDPTAGPVTCLVTTLEPSASTTCVASTPHVVTAAEALAGRVENTATAVGRTPFGLSEVSSPDTIQVPVGVLALTGSTVPGWGAGVGVLALGIAILVVIRIRRQQRAS